MPFLRTGRVSKRAAKEPEDVPAPKQFDIPYFAHNQLDPIKYSGMSIAPFVIMVTSRCAIPLTNAKQASDSLSSYLLLVKRQRKGKFGTTGLMMMTRSEPAMTMRLHRM